MVLPTMQSLILCLVASLPLVATATSSTASITSNQFYLRKKPATRRYLTCDSVQHACGNSNNKNGVVDNDHHITICHYNGNSFETLCLPSRSSIVEQRDARDTCGACPTVISSPPKAQRTRAFATREELTAAIDIYLQEEEEDTLQQQHAALATTYGYPMGAWDVSQIADFSHLFALRTHFNEDLSQWNMESATDLSFMFHHAHKFDGRGLGNWDIRRVQSLEQTFFGAESFQADLSGWTPTASLTNMRGTFWRATHFNSDIGNWNIRGVTTLRRCFSDALQFDQDLSGWETSAVTDMSYMFWQAISFRQVPHAWDISNVQTKEQMFANVPYYESKHVQQDLLDVWPNNNNEDMFTAPQIKSLRTQQLESLGMDLSAMIRIAKKSKQNTTHYDSEEQQHLRDNEARRQDLSQEIRCHGGVCI